MHSNTYCFIQMLLCSFVIHCKWNVSHHTALVDQLQQLTAAKLNYSADHNYLLTSGLSEGICRTSTHSFTLLITAYTSRDCCSSLLMCSILYGGPFFWG